MAPLRKLVIGCALLVLATIAVAQAEGGDKAKPEKPKPEPAVKIGDKAPPIKADSIINGKLKSLSELRGRLVLYDYFQHW
jgi:hypothetical protein